MAFMHYLHMCGFIGVDAKLGKAHLKVRKIKFFNNWFK